MLGFTGKGSSVPKLSLRCVDLVSHSFCVRAKAMLMTWKGRCIKLTGLKGSSYAHEISYC